MGTDKDKDQSIFEFFEALQIEYYINEIRKKIYPFHKDRIYYERTMVLKKEKILDIAQKNNLKCIFNDDETKLVYIKKVYPTKGLPNFGKHLDYRDIKNYYKIGSDVKYNIDDGGDYIVGKIENVDIDKGFASIKFYNGEKSECKLTDITRIL